MAGNPRFDSWVIRMTINNLYAQHRFESTREGARFLFMNKDTLDRILTGKTQRHDPTRIQGMAKRLGATDTAADQLFNLAVQTHDTSASGYQQPGKPGGPTGDSPFAVVESAASRIDIYEDSLVAGMLQIREYMEALAEVDPFITSAGQAQEIVRYKLGRQKTLLEEGSAPETRVVLNEQVLHRFRQRRFYQAQVDHMRETSERYNIGIYVFPLAAGLNNANSGAFTLMGLDSPVTFEVAFLDAYTGGTWVEDQDSLAYLRKLYRVILPRCVELGAYLDADQQMAEVQPQ